LPAAEPMMTGLNTFEYVEDGRAKYLKKTLKTQFICAVTSYDKRTYGKYKNIY
jgi:hypothetical protein